MKYIDDLSYSNLVNLIQGEEKKGADILTNIAINVKVYTQKWTLENFCSYTFKCSIVK